MRYIAAHAPGWRNVKHASQWRNTLTTYAFPIIGDLPVSSITDKHVLSILQPIWAVKTETAKRLQCRVENILDWATAMKYRSGENPARWRGFLDKLLARPSRVKKVRHHPAMPYAGVPAFFVELAAKDGMSSLALRFLILTGCRTREVLEARWSEIDMGASIWTIPASRMKAVREHRVPLSDEALSVLHALPHIAGSDYVFPGARVGRPLSGMALLQLMRGMGYGVGGDRGDFVPHGFRSSFRDWCAEQSSFSREVAEAALAHALRDKTEAAYQRGDLFEKRRKLMTAWGEYCAAPTGGDEVDPVNSARVVRVTSGAVRRGPTPMRP
jgi:integrase